MTANAAMHERNPFLEAVGRVTVAGAHLDLSLHNLLGQIAFEPTLIKLANAEGTARLIELCELALQTYGSDIPAEDVATVSRCLVQAKSLKDKRNMVVHSLFFQSLEGGELEAAKPLRKRLGQRVTKITISEMEIIADSLEALCGDLFRAGWNAGTHSSGMPRIAPQPTSEGVGVTSD
jgi:hypothetical protein